VLLLERVARLNPLSESDPADLLDEQLTAEPGKRIEPEMAELMDVLGVSR
jgi:hypothetical protein